ncbi:MAG: transporter permease [Herbinix sp.]|jgi:multidrug/hemolysin transport system permease protein|nr:transporter permease [Herbinix sp.]
MLLIRLIKRNMLVYVRDRANIFFSLLSMIIIIGLMVVFLGKMNADNVVNLLNEYGGGDRNAAADLENAQQLIILWTLAGIVVVNSVTITLSMVGIMVEDEAHKKLSSFFVSPVKRTVFVLGYVIAAILMGIIMCTLTFALGEAYIAVTGGDLLTPAQMLQVIFYIILNVFTSASLVFLIANFVHSLSAFSGLSTVIGTIVGFIAGIYLPIGMLPEKVQMVLKCFPLFYGCSLLRELFTESIIIKTFVNCPEQLINSYKETMGITVLYQDNIVPHNVKVAILVISGIIFIGISVIVQRRRNVMNR